MNKARETKKWKVIEVQIKQASEFLSDPSLFIMNEYSLEEYEINNHKKELINSMLKLEIIAKNKGCKSSFWRRLQKAAINIGEQAKVEEYENEFHTALSKNV